MRKILVVIDMQNDFIDGSLGTKEAQQIVPRVVEKMKEYDPWNIYLTRDTAKLKFERSLTERQKTEEGNL